MILLEETSIWEFITNEQFFKTITDMEKIDEDMLRVIKEIENEHVEAIDISQ